MPVIINCYYLCFFAYVNQLSFIQICQVGIMNGKDDKFCACGFHLHHRLTLKAHTLFVILYCVGTLYRYI